MPGLKGEELVERVMSIRPDVKVLYMSAYTEDAIVNLGILAPGTNFIEKPFGPGGSGQKGTQSPGGSGGITPAGLIRKPHFFILPLGAPKQKAPVAIHEPIPHSELESRGDGFSADRRGTEGSLGSPRRPRDDNAKDVAGGGVRDNFGKLGMSV